MVASRTEIEGGAGVEAPTATPFDLTATCEAILAICRTNPGIDGLRITLTRQGQAAGRFDVPLARADADEGVTATQQRIIDKLAASESPLSRWQLAQQLKLKNMRGRFGVDVSRLLEQEKIYEQDGSLTDDPNKFGDMN